MQITPGGMFSFTAGNKLLLTGYNMLHKFIDFLVREKPNANQRQGFKTSSPKPKKTTSS
jgi:hypothetical protein